MSKFNYNTVYVTRYMGAKYKLLDLIIPEIKKIVPPTGTVIDLMSGTQSVGYALKKDYRIISNDIQFYSQVFAKALIVNNSKRNVRDDFPKDFDNLEPNGFSENWFVKTYKNTYFSEGQAKQISAIRSRIDEISDLDKQYIYLTALATAMSTCQSSSGHFAQFMPQDHPRIKVLRDMNLFEYFAKKCKEIEIELSEYQNFAFGMEGSELLESSEIKELAPEGSLVYLDPPYSSAQYSRYYHLLETVFLNDEPQVNFKGLYRPDRFQSDFSSPKRVKHAFERIFRNCANLGYNLLISYSDGGLIELSEMKVLCKKYFRNVELKYELYPHSMQGRGQVENRHEVIFVCN